MARDWARPDASFVAESGGGTSCRRGPFHSVPAGEAVRFPQRTRWSPILRRAQGSSMPEAIARQNRHPAASLNSSSMGLGMLR